MNLHEYYQPTPDAPSLRLDRLLPKCSPSEVWNLLFDPANAARIWFGSSMEADLRAGGVVRWFGSWEGVHFEDRAQVLESETYALFDAIYFSSFSGQAEHTPAVDHPFDPRRRWNLRAFGTCQFP